MKNPIKSLFALAALGATALVAQAQPAPKILVVDLAKLFDSHYKTEEQTTKLRADQQKAQQELERLNKEGSSLVEKYKELVDQSNNPAATAEAKSKAQGDAQKMLEDIQRKQQEVQSFQNNTRNSLEQRFQNFRSLMVEEISKIAIEIAKKKGATLLVDKAGPTLIGVSNVLYFDPSYDITDDVAKEINKDRPATPAAAPAAAPATKTEPEAADTPKITVPGVTPKK